MVEYLMKKIDWNFLPTDKIIDEIRKAPYQFIGQKATPRNIFRIVEVYKKMLDNVGLDYSCIATKYDYSDGMLHITPMPHKNDPFFSYQIDHITIDIVLEGDKLWKKVLKLLTFPLRGFLVKLKRSKKK